MAKPRALIIGGSMGGLFAANLLRSVGWEVAVYERATGHLGDRGTGIGTREELFAVMRRLKLAIDARIGTEVHGRIALDRSGTVIHTLPIRAMTSAWARIWNPLRQALPDGCYRGGQALTRVTQHADGVDAAFSDGSSAEGDLLIAADGLHSTVRAQFLPDLRPRYAGYVAWRGVMEQRALPASLQDMVLRQMIFGFPNGELMLSIPMPGPDDGPHRSERRCHFVWFRQVDEDALADLCIDDSGRAHGFAIPPPLIRTELVRKLIADAEARLPPQLAMLVKSAAQIILQPIFDLASPRMVFDRTVLLGDAAFVARPHVATGVMKAALDAQCLADRLAESASDIGKALGGYQRERSAFGHWLVERGRHIGRYFEAYDDGSRQRIETLMREYGAAGLVANHPIIARGSP